MSAPAGTIVSTPRNVAGRAYTCVTPSGVARPTDWPLPGQLAQAAAAVLAAESGADQVGEEVGRAGEGGDAEFGHRGGVAVLVARRAVVVEREQYDGLYPGVDKLAQAADHLGATAALVEVADEHED